MLLEEELFEAAKLGHNSRIIELLNIGANINVISSSGRTVLGAAVQYGHISTVKILLKAEEYFSTDKSTTDNTGGGKSESKLGFKNGLGVRVRHRWPSSHRERARVARTRRIQSKTSDSSDSESQVSSTGNSIKCSDSTGSIRNGIGSHQIANHTSSKGTGERQRRKRNSLYRSALTDFYRYRHTHSDISETGESESSSSLKETEFSADDGTSSGRVSPDIDGMNISTKASLNENKENVLMDDFNQKKMDIESIDNTDANVVEKIPLKSHFIDDINIHATEDSSDSAFEARRKKYPSSLGPTNSSDWFPMYHSYNGYLDYNMSIHSSCERKCNINLQDSYGRCALHYAVEQGHKDIVNLLINSGCQLDVKDVDNLVPLHLACARGNLKIVNDLLLASADINSKTSDKMSALHMATSRGYTDVANLMIEQGAKVNALDSSDRTPLMLAVSRQHEHTIKLLLKNGAKVDFEEIHGYTPLCEAVWQKHFSIVELLLKNGAKILSKHHLVHYAVSRQQYFVTEILLRFGAVSQINDFDDNGDTPLILAARSGDLKIIQLLLSHGADVNIENSLTKNTVLHECVESLNNWNFFKFKSIFKVLIKHEVNLHAINLVEENALYRAILMDRIATAELLIKNGINVDFIHIKLSAVKGHVYLCRLLVAAGVKIDIRSSVSTSSNEIETMINNAKSTPLKLFDISRIYIRSYLGYNVQEKIKRITCLPVKVKEFLLLKHIS